MSDNRCLKTVLKYATHSLNEIDFQLKGEKNEKKIDRRELENE